MLRWLLKCVVQPVMTCQKVMRMFNKQKVLIWWVRESECVCVCERERLERRRGNVSDKKRERERWNEIRRHTNSVCNTRCPPQVMLLILDNIGPDSSGINGENPECEWVWVCERECVWWVRCVQWVWICERVSVSEYVPFSISLSSTPLSPCPSTQWKNFSVSLCLSHTAPVLEERSCNTTYLGRWVWVWDWVKGEKC